MKWAGQHRGFDTVMDPSQDELQRQFQSIRDQIRDLFQANEDIWTAVVAGGLKRSEGLQQLINNGAELAALGKAERELATEMLRLEHEIGS
jgi:hypothetical protein